MCSSGSVEWPVKRTKKERERYYATLLTKHAFPGATLDPIDHERPDFRLTQHSKIIGLELTELLDPEETLTDSAGVELEQRLHQLRETANDPTSLLTRINVIPHPRAFGEKQRYWPPKKDHERFCNDLLGLILDQATGDYQTIMTPDDHPNLACLDRIDVLPTGTAILRWQLPPQIRFVDLDEPLLAQRVNEKKRLATTYERTGLDELWLAIIPGPWEDTLEDDGWQNALTNVTGIDPQPFDRIVIANPNDPEHSVLATIP